MTFSTAIRSVPDYLLKSLIKFLIQYPTLEILHRNLLGIRTPHHLIWCIFRVGYWSRELINVNYIFHVSLKTNFMTNILKQYNFFFGFHSIEMWHSQLLLSKIVARQGEILMMTLWLDGLFMSLSPVLYLLNSRRRSPYVRIGINSKGRGPSGVHEGSMTK